MERPRYSPEFRQLVVKEALEAKNCACVARTYGLAYTTVCRWVHQAKVDVIEENRRLRKLVKEQNMENKVLRNLLVKQLEQMTQHF